MNGLGLEGPQKLAGWRCLVMSYVLALLIDRFFKAGCTYLPWIDDMCSFKDGRKSVSATLATV